MKISKTIRKIISFTCALLCACSLSGCSTAMQSLADGTDAILSGLADGTDIVAQRQSSGRLDAA